MSYFKSIAVILIAAVSITSCSFFKEEDPLARERAEQQEVIDGFFVTYWRGAKISIRSLPITGKEDAIDFRTIQANQNKKMSLGPQLSGIFSYVNRTVLEDRKDLERPVLNTTDLIALAKEIYDLKSTVSSIDEDQYPTFIEVVNNAQKALKKEPVHIPDGWNTSFEHWVFALVMEAKAAPGSWKTYELSKIDFKSLPKTDYQILASFQNALNHIRNGWFYLAEESTTNTLELLTDEVRLSEELAPMHIPVEGMKNEEIFRVQMRGVAKLLRGFSRFKTENATLEEPALQDFADALSDFQAIGMNNELTWMTAAFLYIKQGETDKALSNIEKLEGSKYAGRHEKKMLAETKAHLESRNPDAALATITDKVVMFNIGIGYAKSYLLEMKWTRFLEKSEVGRRLLNMFPELERSYDKAKKYLDLEMISEEARQLLE